MEFPDKKRREIDGVDILFLFWIMLVALVWIGPAIQDHVGKAKAFVTESMLLIGVVGYLRFRRLPIRELCRWNLVPLQVVPYFILFAVSGSVLLDGLDRLVGLVIPMPAETAESYRLELGASTVLEKFLVVLGIGLAAPIVEETIFRGVIQSTFERRSDVTKGIMLTALIFGLIHFQIAWLIQILIMSVFLGWMAWQWKSIIPAVILHAANNTLTYFIMFDANESFEAIYLVQGQLNPIIALISGAIAYYAFIKMVSAYRRINITITD